MNYLLLVLTLVSSVALGASNKIKNKDIASDAAIDLSKIATPLTTKGDILTRDASGYVRFPVCADGEVMRAAASEASGWECATASSGGGTWGSITGTLSDQTDLNTALGLKAPLASPSFSGTVTLPTGLTGFVKAASGVVSAGTIAGSDLPAPAASAISASDIDWSTLLKTGGVYTKTLGANTTFTFSNLAVGTIVVRLTNTASNYTVTWPTVKWAGGEAPTMSTGAASDIYTFIYDGTDVYGSYVQEGASGGGGGGGNWTSIAQTGTLTRVTGSAPSTVGNYRSYLRQGGGYTFSETNGSPTTAPGSTNGFLLYGGNSFASADSNNSPTRYDINVGTGKKVYFEFYNSAGRTGAISTAIIPNSSRDRGVRAAYDPTTGIATVAAFRFNNGDNACGMSPDGSTDYTQCYFDIWVQ